MLIGEMRVPADWRNGDPEEAGAGRRRRLEAPVRMPVFGEDRGGLVGRSLHSDNMLPARDRGDERILSERAECESKPLKIVVRQRLIRKGQNAVFEPCCANIVNFAISEGPGQIKPRDFSAARSAARG